MTMTVKVGVIILFIFLDHCTKAITTPVGANKSSLFSKKNTSDTISYLDRYYRHIQLQALGSVINAMTTTNEHERVKRYTSNFPEDKVFMVSTDLPKLFKMAVRVMYDTYKATWFSLKPTPLKFTIIPPVKYFFNADKNFV